MNMIQTATGAFGALAGVLRSARLKDLEEDVRKNRAEFATKCDKDLKDINTAANLGAFTNPDVVAEFMRQAVYRDVIDAKVTDAQAALDRAQSEGETYRVVQGASEVVQGMNLFPAGRTYEGQQVYRTESGQLFIPLLAGVTGGIVGNFLANPATERTDPTKSLAPRL